MEIDYSDFEKIEMRVGTIIVAEVVEDADKLLRLTVDFGEDTPRQIISAIREKISDPAGLVGKQCPFVVNLKPRKIRGLESRAMILAVGHGDIFSLLHPSVPVPPGTCL